MTAPDPKQRFTDRVDSYTRHRPHYPEPAINRIVEWAALRSGSVVADVGSGTGISSGPFLRRGIVVHCVEPNAAMRAAAERELARFDGFRSVDGSAEATTLADASVDLVLCAQAFHWFDRTAGRTEFLRISKSPHRVVLIWNTRRRSGTPFLDAYERMLEDFGTDYSTVSHTNISDEQIASFFGSAFTKQVIDHAQRFDLAGVRGRLGSSSYVPGANHPNHGPMLQRLESIFNQHEVDGHVTMGLHTEIYLGMLRSP